MLNVNEIIQSGGLLLIGLIIFAESGMLVGFFLPGDTLLFSAGIFAAQGKLPLGWLLLVIVVAAVIGDNVGYTIGEKAGPKIFTKNEGVFFKKEHVVRAEAFYQKHGGKTVLFARFIPIIRTFAPLVAGVGKMPRKRFIPFEFIGAVFWGVGVTMAAYWFGSKIPNIDQYLLPAVLAATVITFSPTVYHLIKEPRARKAIKQKMFFWDSTNKKN